MFLQKSMFYHPKCTELHLSVQMSTLNYQVQSVFLSKVNLQGIFQKIKVIFWYLQKLWKIHSTVSLNIQLYRIKIFFKDTLVISILIKIQIIWKITQKCIFPQIEEMKKIWKVELENCKKKCAKIKKIWNSTVTKLVISKCNFPHHLHQTYSTALILIPLLALLEMLLNRYLTSKVSIISRILIKIYFLLNQLWTHLKNLILRKKWSKLTLLKSK